MVHIYNAVTAIGFPNFKSAKIVLPSNLNFEEWDMISHILEDETTITLLKYGFPAGYEGLVTTPSFGNHR